MKVARVALEEAAVRSKGHDGDALGDITVDGYRIRSATADRFAMLCPEHGYHLHVDIFVEMSTN